MGFRKIAFLIVATLACGSAALAGTGGRVTSAAGMGGFAGPNRSNGATHFFIVRTPLPIRQPFASTGTVGFGASSSRIDSRIDSKKKESFDEGRGDAAPCRGRQSFRGFSTEISGSESLCVRRPLCPQ